MYTSEHQEKKTIIGYTDTQTCNTIQKLYRCAVGIAHLHDHSHRTNSDIIRKELYITRIVYSSKYHNASNEFWNKIKKFLQVLLIKSMQYISQSHTIKFTLTKYFQSHSMCMVNSILYIESSLSVV